MVVTKAESDKPKNVSWAGFHKGQISLLWWPSIKWSTKLEIIVYVCFSQWIEFKSSSIQPATRVTLQVESGLSVKAVNCSKIDDLFFSKNSLNFPREQISSIKAAALCHRFRIPFEKSKRLKRLNIDFVFPFVDVSAKKFTLTYSVRFRIVRHPQTCSAQ